MAASGEYINLLPIKAQNYFRKVDSIRHKSSNDIKDIFTVDLTPNKIEAIGKTSKIYVKENYKTKTSKRWDNLKQIKDPNYKLEVRFIEDNELVTLFEDVPTKVIKKFRKMYELYSKGSWAEAKVGLEKIVHYVKDGPSMFLLEVMRHYNYVPPANWKGFRELN